MTPRPTGALVALAVLAACTGGTSTVEPTGSPARSVATSTSEPAGRSGDGPASPSPSTSPSPSRSPSAAPAVEVGVGEVVLTAADDAFLSTPVAGDCLLAGSSLPGDGTGQAMGDDVETFLAVDNYLGPFGQEAAPQPVVLTVDGSEGTADVSLFGGPGGWNWWEGEVAAATLSDPVTQDGVATATLAITATLDRASRTQTGMPAPRPPRGGRGGGGAGRGDGGSPGPASPAARQVEPDHDVAPDRARGGRVVVQPVGAFGEAGATPTPTPSATPAEPAPARSLDLLLTVTCTTLR